MTEKIVLGQAQRILVNATSDIWHRISSWTHASDVEMPDGTPLNTYLTDMNDELNTKLDEKYGSLPNTITDISTFDAIPDLTYGRLHTVTELTDGKYTIPTNHYLYSYSGSHPKTIQRFAVLIDTTDLSNIVMYIADKNIENKWTLTKIATQDQIDGLQQQINDLSTEFNNLNLFVQQSIGGINQLYQILQNQMDWLEEQLAELQEQVNDLLNELRDFKKAINGRVDAIEKIFQELYGYVGALYITTSAGAGKVLSRLFGGKWVLVQNAYLYATGFLGERNGYDIEVPGNNNYREMRGSELGNQTISHAREWGYERDYSQIFSGNDSFSINTENLPPHRHWFGENNSDRLVGYKGRYDDYVQEHNGYGAGYAASVVTNVRFPPGSGDYSVDRIVLPDNSYVMFSRGPNVITSGSYPPGTSTWGSTRDNDHDYTMQSEPIDIEPTKFKVFVWARVE